MLETLAMFSNVQPQLQPQLAQPILVDPLFGWPRREPHRGHSLFQQGCRPASDFRAANEFFNCRTGTDSSSIQCAINAGARMTDFANSGLTSSADFGAVCSFPSPTGTGYYTYAFTGIIPTRHPRLDGTYGS